MADEVQVPAKLVDPSGADLVAPLRGLLRGLGLLESQTDAAKGIKLIDGTPPSLQVIKAGALSVTKAWTTLTASAGFAGVVTTLIAAWKASSDHLQITLVGGASVILVATAIAIALIVRGDVSARAVTTTELYRSRAELSKWFIAGTLAAAAEASGQEEPVARGRDTLAKVLAALNVSVANEGPSPGLYGVRSESATICWKSGAPMAIGSTSALRRSSRSSSRCRHPRPDARREA